MFGDEINIQIGELGHLSLVLSALDELLGVCPQTVNLWFGAQPEVSAKYTHRIQWSASVVSTRGISSHPVIAPKTLL